MSANDRLHPNNDCVVSCQLDRWQMEVVKQIQKDTEKRKNDIIKGLLREPLMRYVNLRNEIAYKAKDEIKEMALNLLRKEEDNTDA